MDYSSNVWLHLLEAFAAAGLGAGAVRACWSAWLWRTRRRSASVGDHPTT